MAIVGVPLDLGANNRGVSQEPTALRQADMVVKLSGTGLAVQDSGDITPQPRDQLDPGDPRMRYLEEIVRVSDRLADRTHQLITQGICPVVLGGDHSVCLGAVSGAATALGHDLVLIYIDAHGDLNTVDTTPTGNIHGMPLAALLGRGAPQLVDVHGLGAKIAPRNLLHIGASDLDEGEVELMKEMRIPSFSLFNLLTDGLAPLLKLLDNLAGRKTWISLDFDAIDQIYAPAAGMPNAKGLSYREISAIATYIGEKCDVIGMDLVEYNPETDVDNKTAELGIELISNFFGEKYSWYSNYLEHNRF